MDEEQKVEMLKSAIIQHIEKVRTMDEFKQMIGTYFKVEKVKPYLLGKLDEWKQNKENYKATIDEQVSELEALKGEIE